MFSDKIKALRAQKGISQSELAKHLDTLQQTVGRWETGKIEPNIPMIKKIASYFDVSTDYLLDNENSITKQISPVAEKDSELVAMSKNLDSENYKTAVKVIKLLTENAERSKRQQFSEDELALINDYRVLDDTDKQMVKNMAGKLRLVVDNSRQGQLPNGSNINQVEVGNIVSPTNITATQTIG